MKMCISIYIYLSQVTRVIKLLQQYQEEKSDVWMWLYMALWECTLKKICKIFKKMNYLISGFCRILVEKMSNAKSYQ